MQRLRPGEMRAVLAVAAVVMAVTLLPYMAALRSAAPGDVFGGFIWGVDDGNVYLSWIRQASEGHLLLANQYATDPQNPHFFNVFLLVAGLICRLSGLAPIYVFHGLRVVGGVFMLGAFYWLVSLLTRDRHIRWAALGLVALGSGLGWAVVLLEEAGVHVGLRPVDVGLGWQTQPEAVTFVSALLNPLFITSMGLICLTLGHALRAVEENRLRSAALAGVLLLVLGNIHSYDIFAVHVTLGAWLLYGVVTRRYELGPAAFIYAVIFLIGLPAPLWSYWAANQDPSYLVKAWTPTLSAGCVNYVVSYGLLAILAAVGAWAAFRRRRQTFDAEDLGEYVPPDLLKFAVFWAIANSVVLALPVSFQRKLVEGLHMPVAILAGVGIVYLARLLTRRAAEEGRLQTVRERMVLTIIGAIVLCLPSNALFVSQCLGHVKTNNEQLLHVLAPPIYLSADYAEAVGWLGANARAGEVVLSSSLIGNHIPAAAPCTVYVGHWAETLYFSRKLGKVAEFFSPGTGVERRLDVLWGDVRATYVVYGPYERLIGGSTRWGIGYGEGDEGIDLEEATGGVLRRAFEAGDVKVYEVDM